MIIRAAIAACLLAIVIAVAACGVTIYVGDAGDIQDAGCDAAGHDSGCSGG